MVELGAVLWVALWLGEVAYKEFISRRTAIREDCWLPREPMECQACKEISLVAIGIVRPKKGNAFVEYECEECGHYETT